MGDEEGIVEVRGGNTEKVFISAPTEGLPLTRD